MNRYTVKVGVVVLALCYLTMPWHSTGPLASAQEKIDKAKAAKKELAALQGTWSVMAAEEKGKEVPGKGNLYVIDKDQMTFKSEKGGVIAKGTLELDPTRSPKHMDYRLTSRKQTDLIIYIRVGGYLIVCGRRDGKTRASEFATGMANGGEYLQVLKRVK
jgi:uncharacterized protein (TIGR03067 family)